MSVDYDWYVRHIGPFLWACTRDNAIYDWDSGEPIGGATMSDTAAVTTRIPAEVFPPGDLLSEELAERHWTADDLARKSGLAPATIAAILGGHGRIDARIACALEDALGTSAALWVNLDLSWRRR